VQGKKEFKQRIYYNINLDSLVPEDHFLRRLNSLVSFDFVRDITKNYYSHTGKPSIDPVVLVKMLLIGYLFDIRSERKLVEEISLNLAYRWYIGYDLDEEVPNHSVFSKARKRFGKKIFGKIFEEILKTAIGYGMVSKEGVLVDSSIVKADASIGSIVEVNISPEEYWRKLDESEKIKKPVGRKPKKDKPVNEGSHFNGTPDKDKMGKRRRNRDSSFLKKRSTTDPDATLFYRPGAGSQLSYKAHMAADTNEIITAVTASPSSLHDIGAVPALIESHENVLGTPLWIAADTKYGSEECLAYLQEREIKTSINPDSRSNRPNHFSKEEFTYDEKKDCYICPQGNVLKRKAKNYKLNRIKYRAKKKDCLLCPKRERCIDSKSSNPRTVTRYDSQCYQKASQYYLSDYGRSIQKLRSTIIEGIFGQAKAFHGMARAKFRGLKKVEIQFILTATALNLKKMVKMMDMDRLKSTIPDKVSNIICIGRNILRSLLIKLALEWS